MKQIFIPMLSFLIYILPSIGLADEVNFSGSWKLDSKASQSMDPILDLKKISWVKKKLGANLDAKQMINQTKTDLKALAQKIAQHDPYTKH